MRRWQLRVKISDETARLSQAAGTPSGAPTLPLPSHGRCPLQFGDAMFGEITSLQLVHILIPIQSLQPSSMDFLFCEILVALCAPRSALERRIPRKAICELLND